MNTMNGEDMDPSSAFDPEARVARIAERVDNQGARITHLETVVTKGFSDIQQTFGKQFTDLSSEMRNRDRTPWGIIWPAMGVMFAVLFGIGGALYYPVRETMSEMKSDIRMLRSEALSVGAFQDFRATYENNRVVSRTEYIDKFAQLGLAIAAVREDQVPRKELERTWQLYDQSLSFIQTQINDLKRENASVYTSRDKILDQDDKLKKLEDLLRSLQVGRTTTQ